MKLNLTVSTNKPDLMIDYISAKLETAGDIAITWDKSYIERTDTGFFAEYVALNYFDSERNEPVYLHREDIKGIKIEDFGLYTDIKGNTTFKIEEAVFEEDNMDYILDPSVYMNAYHSLEKNLSIFHINDKPYQVIKSYDSGIEREDEEGNTDICEGYYCQLYHASDIDYKNELDNFYLAVGYEIPDLTEKSFEIGVSNYLDNKSIWICVYKDALDYQDDRDNLTYIQVPRLWLYNVMHEEGMCNKNMVDWFNEYTADNTEHIARKAQSDGVIIKCEDKNIPINNKKNISLNDKLRDAENRQGEVNNKSVKEREEFEL